MAENRPDPSELDELDEQIERVRREAIEEAPGRGGDNDSLFGDTEPAFQRTDDPDDDGNMPGL